MAKMKIKVGDEVYVLIPSFKRSGIEPQKGKIVVLSNTPGKQVGVELENAEYGMHNCNGHGEDKRCIYAAPQHIMTEEMVAIYKKKCEFAQQHADAATLDIVEEIEIEI